MFAQAIVWPVLVIASYYDISERRIPNWLVRVGLCAAFLLTLSADAIGWGAGGDHFASWFSYLSLWQSLLGLVLAGILPLMLYVTNNGGAGDVKLAWTIGALLGWRHGCLAILAAYLLSGAWGLIWLILSGRLCFFCCSQLRGVWRLLRPDSGAELKTGEREVHVATVAMSPFIALGVLLAILGESPG